MWIQHIRGFVPPLPENVVEVRTRIIAAVAEVKPEMLCSVWQETSAALPVEVILKRNYPRKNSMYFATL
jgi:hypothetical protein